MCGKDSSGEKKIFDVFYIGLASDDLHLCWTTLLAVETLGRGGRRFVPALVSIITRPGADPQCKGGALKALKEIGPFATQAIPDLIEVFDSDLFRRRELKEECAAVFGAIGPAAATAVPYILEALAERLEDTSDPSGAAVFVGALGNIGAASAIAVPQLITGAEVCLSGDDSDGLLDVFIRALRKIGPAAWPAVPLLIRALKEERSPQLTKLIVTVLGEIGAGAESALPFFHELRKRGPNTTEDACEGIVDDELEQAVDVEAVLEVEGPSLSQLIDGARKLLGWTADEQMPPELLAEFQRSRRDHETMPPKLLAEFQRSQRDHHQMPPELLDELRRSQP